jgi:hypothetical protein
VSILQEVFPRLESRFDEKIEKSLAFGYCQASLSYFSLVSKAMPHHPFRLDRQA